MPLVGEQEGHLAGEKKLASVIPNISFINLESAVEKLVR